MPERALRKKLIRLAHQDPRLRPHLLSILASHKGAMQKEAFKQETSDFIEWVFHRGKRINESEAQRLLEQQGLELSAPSGGTPSRRGQPLAPGEQVEVKASKNQNELNIDACSQWNGKVGTIKETRDGGLVVDFDGRLGFFNGSAAGQSTGLYRWSQVDDKGGSLIEVVYLTDKSAPPPGPDQVEMVRQYVYQGEIKGDKRHRSYYTGLVSSMKMTKDGSRMYFLMWPQQRKGRPRSISPAKGTLLYIGAQNRRPGGWKNQHAKVFGAVAPL